MLRALQKKHKNITDECITLSLIFCKASQQKRKVLNIRLSCHNMVFKEKKSRRQADRKIRSPSGWTI